MEKQCKLSWEQYINREEVLGLRKFTEEQAIPDRF